MKVWQEYYGADADGNRGQLTTFAELEDGDDDEVVDALYETFIDGKVDGTIEIEINEFYFDVDVEDYIDMLIAKAKDDCRFKEDEDFKQIILDIEIDYLIKKTEMLHKKEQAQNE